MAEKHLDVHLGAKGAGAVDAAFTSLSKSIQGIQRSAQPLNQTMEMLRGGGAAAGIMAGARGLNELGKALIDIQNGAKPAGEALAEAFRHAAGPIGELGATIHELLTGDKFNADNILRGAKLVESVTALIKQNMEQAAKSTESVVELIQKLDRKAIMEATSFPHLTGLGFGKSDALKAVQGELDSELAKARGAAAGVTGPAGTELAAARAARPSPDGSYTVRRQDGTMETRAKNQDAINAAQKRIDTAQAAIASAEAQLAKQEAKLKADADEKRGRIEVRFAADIARAEKEADRQIEDGRRRRAEGIGQTLSSIGNVFKGMAGLRGMTDAERQAKDVAGEMFSLMREVMGGEGEGGRHRDGGGPMLQSVGAQSFRTAMSVPGMPAGYQEYNRQQAKMVELMEEQNRILKEIRDEEVVAF